MSEYRERLDAILTKMDSVTYYNGGQTRSANYPHGSPERAQLVAEAQLYADLLRTQENPAQPSEEN